MGGICSVDSYKQIKQKYGADFGKFVIAQKNRQLLEGLITRLKRDVTEEVGFVKKQNIKYIKEKEAQISEYFLKIKEEFNTKNPIAFKSFEQINSVNLNELMGLNFINQKLKDLREGVELAFEKEQNEMIAELLQVQVNEDSYAQQERPSLMIYNEMADEDKKIVMKRAERQYMNQISAYQDTLLQKYDVKLKKQHYIERFKTILSKESLDSLAQISKDKFVTCYNLMVGNSSSVLKHRND